MTQKFQNKYRIETTRLQTWNYNNAAAYFITICTKNHTHYFGNIVDTRCIAYPNTTSHDITHPDANLPNITMQLSPIGKIVETEWLKTPQIRPDMNLQLDAFVVMPNHFHAIIIIGDNEYNGVGNNDGGHGCNGGGRDGRYAMHRVSTGKPSHKTTNGNHFGPQRKNLASVIRGFKSAVTVNARKTNPQFTWQPRFWDHIIRNDDAYQRIKQYIIDNPKRWKGDKFNTAKVI